MSLQVMLPAQVVYCGQVGVPIMVGRQVGPSQVYVPWQVANPGQVDMSEHVGVPWQVVVPTQVANP
jgi:hypothetical protein